VPKGMPLARLLSPGPSFLVFLLPIALLPAAKLDCDR